MRTSTYPSRLGFVVDPGSIHRNTGRQVDFDNIGEAAYVQGARKVTLSAQANANAVSLTVTALPADLPAGTLLHFGESQEVARVTVKALLGATTVTVEAIPSQIESGDFAYWGGTGKKFLQAGTVVAEIVSTGLVIPRALVPASHATTVGAAVAGNTGNGVLTMAATPTGPNVKEGVYTVRIINPATDAGGFIVDGPDGIVDGYGNVAVAYTGQVKFTLADGATDFIAGDSFTITVTPTYRTLGLLETDAVQDAPQNAKTGFGIIVGGGIYENLLPEATGTPKVLPTQYKTELQAPGVGMGFYWSQYADSR